MITAWLLERYREGVTHYWDGRRWTPDVQFAIRYQRQVDAERTAVAFLTLQGQIFVREHSWEPEHRYGDDRTIHRTGFVDVEIFNGVIPSVVAVWFRCHPVPFQVGVVGKERAAEMRRMYEKPFPPVKAIVFAEDA